MFECVEEVGVEKLAVSLCHGAARVRDSELVLWKELSYW